MIFANDTGYLGVNPGKRPGTWVARIRSKGKTHHLGVFEAPEEAHAAYSEAVWRQETLPIPPREILQMMRTEHPLYGHKPDTYEIAELLRVSEYQVANAIAEARDDEWLKRKTEEANWRQTAPRDPARLARIRPKLAADAASREPAKITLPALTFMEREI